MKELKTGQIIRFKAMCEFTGKELNLEGVVLGNATAVRKMWPIEMSGAENCYLVRREDNFGNDFHHAVFPEEIL